MKRMYLKRILLCIYLFSISDILAAQDVFYPVNNEAIYHHIDRFDVLYPCPNCFYTSTKSYKRSDVTHYAALIDSTKINLSKIDKAALQYIFDDNIDLLAPKNSTDTTPQYKTHKKPIFKYFYQTPANLFEVNTPFFSLKVNPILNVKMALEQDSKETIFLNVRGIELRGSIDNRLYFYSNILETQARFPNYVTNWIIKHRAIPGSSFYKPYNSLLFKIDNGYDYLNAQGYINFNIAPSVGVQIGNGQHFLGDGIRSLLLSNFANNYFYLKFSTQIGKIHYQNIFAELNVNATNVVGDILKIKKYMVLHQLSYNINKNLNVAVFESTIMNQTQHLELKYMNPIIFYNSVEHLIGNSSTNVLVGAHIKWNVAQRFSFYGQTLLNGFTTKELLAGSKGWWGNKYGVQVGAKYFNALNIDHLDLQVEYNKVRPFTYSATDSYQNYTHDFQNLAHPLGAGFKEVLVKGRFQPIWKLVFDGRLMYANVGENSTTTNWGNEPIVASTTKKNDYGYFTTEGVNAKILLMTLDMSYQFRPNMFADIQILARKKDSQDPLRNERTFFVGGGLRMNIGNSRHDF